jgi:hypothetical protein
MCPEDSYCYFHVCSVETGVCQPRPEACPDIWAPVCGCDGETYSNTCYAALYGMSVDYLGPCQVVLSGRGTALVDGVLTEGEWVAAATVEFLATLPLPDGGTAPGTLYVMNDATELYLAVGIEGTPVDQGSVTFEFDNDNDHQWPEVDDDALQVSSRRGFADGFRTDAGRPALDTNDGGTSDGLGAVATDGQRLAFELSHPLDSADDSHDFSLSYYENVGVYLRLRLCAAGGCVDTFVPGPDAGTYSRIRILSP